MVKYELESALRRGQDHQQKQSEAVIRVTVFISRKDLISSQKWLLSTRVYFHTSGFILPLKHQGPFKAQSPQSQHSLRPGSGSSNDWDHIKRYRHLKLETILKSLRIRKVWTVVRRTLKHIGCIQSTIGPTRRDSTVRRSTRRARLPTTPGSVHASSSAHFHHQTKYEDIGGFVLFNNVHHQKLFKDPWEPSSTVLLTSLHSSDSFTYCTHSDFSAFSFSQLRSELSFSSIKHKRLTQSLELCVIL